jgi:4-diphosphocytidyl-2-C-methyl-D-erythritol kinase
MRGIGDILSAPLKLPKLGIVIVHPGVAAPTGPVFKALGVAPGERRAAPASVEPPWSMGGPGNRGGDGRDVLAWLADQSNDLEAAAIAIAPAIADVLGTIRDLPGCRLSRMSGSGSACFGLFDSTRTALAAKRRLVLARRDWWVRAGRVGG